MTSAQLAAKRFLGHQFDIASPHSLPPMTVWAVVLGSTFMLAIQAWAPIVEFFHGHPALMRGLVGSLGAGLATGIGAAPILLLRHVSAKAQDIMLGFGAGVMLAASVFSLIIPSIDAASLQTGSKTLAALMVAAGIGLGGLFLLLADKLLPHEHFIKGPEGSTRMRVQRVWLFVFAITLHNFPEGLAVGVAFAGGDAGVLLATGMGLQNLPEGLVVAAALLTVGYSRIKAFLIASATGLVEPIGGLLGAGVVTAVQPLLPWALAFAAGAMLFVVNHEIVPESHRKGHEKLATGGVLVGFILMMVLDTSAIEWFD